MRELASGLAFPEGPVALPDGSVLVVEIQAGRLTRVWGEGRTETVAQLGGGPNGAAMGPDGACYICNNGGAATHPDGSFMLPPDPPADGGGGRIERVNLATGKVERVLDRIDGVALNGPNDLVFDDQGGFYFSDMGKGRGRALDRGVVWYAKADGTGARQVVYPMLLPNGVGLSPDGKTLYVAETPTARLFAFDVTGPGVVASSHPLIPGRFVGAGAGPVFFDSLAVDAAGTVHVATLFNGGITSFAPDGSSIRHVATGDPFTTNLCFGGADMRTAYVTLSGAGRLVAMDWPSAGLRLPHGGWA
ncbi:SMP-30/gluconolactonase/LRE family protein [Zavarzinia sp. CC-PAN008]|uniref:SMP-30/gluconolactonase/LRE family protein n=1 Tax=Zavarzinia sp. CC-PAN008 TaxID=3243332 RepID=UPI003F746351